MSIQVNWLNNKQLSMAKGSIGMAGVTEFRTCEIWELNCQENPEFDKWYVLKLDVWLNFVFVFS